MNNPPEENQDLSGQLPVDLAEALNRTMGDKELIQMLFDDFRSMIGDHLEVIRTAMNSGDMDTLMKEAHQLKGSAGSVCVTAVAAKAYDLERMGEGLLPVDAGTVEELETEIKRPPPLNLWVEGGKK